MTRIEAGDARPILANIQVLRFLAALSVATKHALVMIAPNSVLLNIPFSGGVDVFFVISGFIMAWVTRGCFGKPGKARTFLVRRLIRIVPAYWFFTLAIAAVALIAPQVLHVTRWDPALFITSLAFIPWRAPSGAFIPLLSVGWTLNYEMFFYACFAAALLIVRGRLAIVATLAILAAVGFVIGPRDDVVGFYTDSLLLSFVMGIALEEMRHRGWRLRWWAILPCLGAAIAWYMAMQALGFWSYRFVILGIPATLLAAPFILARDGGAGLLPRLFVIGGDASYALYLSHSFVIAAVALVSSGKTSAAVAIIVALLGCVAVAILFHRLFERPVTRWLQRRYGVGPSAGHSLAP